MEVVIDVGKHGSAHDRPSATPRQRGGGAKRPRPSAETTVGHFPSGPHPRAALFFVPCGSNTSMWEIMWQNVMSYLTSVLRTSSSLHTLGARGSSSSPSPSSGQCCAILGAPKNPPVRSGYVPELCKVSLTRQAKVWQAPFLLSECLSRSATNLSKLHLNFCHQMIWINPEHPKQLTAIFRNLADVSLSGIFPECDLSWTLFILEAAPALQKFTLLLYLFNLIDTLVWIWHVFGYSALTTYLQICLISNVTALSYMAWCQLFLTCLVYFLCPRMKLSRAQLCAKTAVDSAEKTNVVWRPSKDLKHLNLKKLAFQGFKEEDKVTNYIRLVMERAVGLKRIVLLGELPCQDCNDCKRKCMLGELPSKDCNDCKRKCKVDKARRRRVKEQLAHGSCSSVEIIICTLKCQH
ncbi:hypothetical protein VPH35_101688 [Triticum aestivum]